jgi:hypothetical protein
MSPPLRWGKQGGPGAIEVLRKEVRQNEFAGNRQFRMAARSQQIVEHRAARVFVGSFMVERSPVPRT